MCGIIVTNQPSVKHSSSGHLRSREHTDIGPFDANALELAIQLKDQIQAKVYAYSLGEKLATVTLRRAFAVRTDEGVLVQLDPTTLDSMGVAKLLAAAIRRTGGVDLVLCGRQGAIGMPDRWDSYAPSNQLRVSKVRDIMLSERKPFATVMPADLGFSKPPLAMIETCGLQTPPRQCQRAEFVDGQTAAEKAVKLAERILDLLPKG